MGLVYGSVCSGIEAATQAWSPLGWNAKFFSEIEKFPSAVLAHHYGSNMPGEPLAKNGIPNYGDFTQIKANAGPIDLLVGGTPCQSFSVAGKRLGLDDPRGNLALEYLALARRLNARWIVWENVPGVLSSVTDEEDGEGGIQPGLEGREAGDEWIEESDFATFLEFVRECGYGFAYRVLDAQYIRVDGFARAVPQRRRRVFLVGYLGDWRPAAAVLLEPESMRGDSAPRREAGKRVAPTIASRPTGGGGLGTDFDLDGGLIAADVSPTLNAHFGDKMGLENQHINGGCGMFVAHSLRADGFDASEDGTGRGTPIVPVVARTLTRGAESAGKGGYAGRRQEDDDNLVAHPLTLAIRGRDGEPDIEWRQDGTANAILTPNGGRAGMGVGAIAFAQNTRDEVRLFGGDGETVGALAAEPGMKQQSYVAHAIQAGALRENPDSGPDGVGVSADVAYTIEARSEVQAVQTAWAVRRLTPTECERLMGFPDCFTNVPWRGKEGSPDGPRYRALGNSMAVNVMRWIGQRIQQADTALSQLQKQPPRPDKAHTLSTQENGGLGHAE